MMPITSAAYATSDHSAAALANLPIPDKLASELRFPKTPWNFSPELFERVRSTTISADKRFKTCELQRSDKEFNFVLKYFFHMKPPGYGVKRIVCIHNPTLCQAFEASVKVIELEAENPINKPKWTQDEPKDLRNNVIERWKRVTRQFSPVEIVGPERIDQFMRVKVLPLWHGSSRAKCDSICTAGFTYFGKHHYFASASAKEGVSSTDPGYFGSGIYFTNSAKYASMYTTDGYLLMSWVAMREPYPVVNDVPHPKMGQDMSLLLGKEHYQNYDAHYIPVASLKPEDSGCMEYFPCSKGQIPAWDEIVVFQTSQSLPRFWVELTADGPHCLTLEDHTPIPTQTVSLSDPKHILKPIPKFISKPNPKAEKTEEQIKAETQKASLPSTTVEKKEAAPSGASLPVVSPFITPPKKPASSTSPASNADALGTKSVSPSNSPSPVIPTPVTTTPKKSASSTSPASSTEPKLPSEQYDLAMKLLKENQSEIAVKWLQKASNSEHSAAQCQLGACYYLGQGVPKDQKEAVKFYRLSAAKNYQPAKYYLARCLHLGDGIEKQIGEAVKLYLELANQGHRAAQYYLATCYLAGEGIAKNPTEAIKWYQKAADQGDEDAKKALSGLKKGP